MLVYFFTIGLGLQQIHAQSIDNQFFNDVDMLLKKHVQDNQINYEALVDNLQLDALVNRIAKMDLSDANENTKKAFYINAYNLLVMKGVTERYPINSVQEINGFFDSRKWTVANQKVILNKLEKDWLLKTYKDARFHFVLVCGAVDCPPITNFAYRPDLLESQLNEQTKLALNNPNFLKTNDGDVELSEIFKWYVNDFGGNKSAVLTFINRYRNQRISDDTKISYYTYNWALNDANLATDPSKGNNDFRYVVSAAIPKGTTETKFFSNLYTQETGNGGELTDRASFFTNSLSFLYGVNNRFNAGFDLRYRRVRYDQLPSSPFGVLGNAEGGDNRQGITNFGPKIRWAPTAKLPNFSIQSAFWIPVGSDLEGNDTERYIDWDGATWNTQFFNDLSIGTNFSLFTEIDLLWEDIGGADDLNRVSTPATVIFSYFPSPMSTIYVLTNFSPFWQANFDYFAQAGVGAKYQITRNFEVELLYTAFTNQFLADINGNASTFNIGIRINR